MQVHCSCGLSRLFNHKRDGRLARLICECGLVGDWARMPGLPVARQSRRAPEAGESGAPAPFKLTPGRAVRVARSPGTERALAVDWPGRALLAESKVNVLVSDVERLRGELAAAHRRIADLELDLRHERQARQPVPSASRFQYLPGDAGDLDELRDGKDGGQ